MCTEQTGCAILDEWSANRKVSRNASAVSDAPIIGGQVGSGSRAGRVRYSCLKEAARGWGDSMEFESILVSKALPDREFRQNPVIDAHRYMTSLQPCA